MDDYRNLLKEDRWSEIRDYIMPFSDEELSLLSKKDLVKTAPQGPLRMKLNVFATNYMNDILLYEVKDLSYSTPLANYDDNPSEPRWNPDIGSYDLRGVITSIKFKNVSKYVTLDLESVRDAIREKKEQLHSLILDGSALMDEDMSIILDIVSDLPKCSTVDLSFNRLYGVDTDMDKHLNSLLDLPHVREVIVIGNPIVSIERSKFFLTMNDAAASKLVWIPKCWLSNKVWKIMVPEGKHDLVSQVHKKYYYEKSNS